MKKRTEQQNKEVSINAANRSHFMGSLCREWIRYHKPAIYDQLALLVEEKYPRMSRARSNVTSTTISGIKE